MASGSSSRTARGGETGERVVGARAGACLRRRSGRGASVGAMLACLVLLLMHGALANPDEARYEASGSLASSLDQAILSTSSLQPSGLLMIDEDPISVIHSDPTSRQKDMREKSLSARTAAEPQIALHSAFTQESFIKATNHTNHSPAEGSIQRAEPSFMIPSSAVVNVRNQSSSSGLVFRTHTITSLVQSKPLSHPVSPVATDITSSSLVIPPLSVLLSPTLPSSPVSPVLSSILLPSLSSADSTSLGSSLKVTKLECNKSVSVPTSALQAVGSDTLVSEEQLSLQYTLNTPVESDTHTQSYKSFVQSQMWNPVANGTSRKEPDLSLSSVTHLSGEPSQELASVSHNPRGTMRDHGKLYFPSVSAVPQDPSSGSQVELHDSKISIFTKVYEESSTQSAAAPEQLIHTKEDLSVALLANERETVPSNSVLNTHLLVSPTAFSDIYKNPTSPQYKPFLRRPTELIPTGYLNWEDVPYSSDNDKSLMSHRRYLTTKVPSLNSLLETGMTTVESQILLSGPAEKIVPANFLEKYVSFSESTKKPNKMLSMLASSAFSEYIPSTSVQDISTNGMFLAHGTEQTAKGFWHVPPTYIPSTAFVFHKIDTVSSETTRKAVTLSTPLISADFSSATTKQVADGLSSTETSVLSDRKSLTSQNSIISTFVTTSGPEGHIQETFTPVRLTESEKPLSNFTDQDKHFSAVVSTSVQTPIETRPSFVSKFLGSTYNQRSSNMLVSSTSSLFLHRMMQTTKADLEKSDNSMSSNVTMPTTLGIFTISDQTMVSKDTLGDETTAIVSSQQTSGTGSQGLNSTPIRPNGVSVGKEGSVNNGFVTTFRLKAKSEASNSNSAVTKGFSDIVKHPLQEVHEQSSLSLNNTSVLWQMILNRSSSEERGMQVLPFTVPVSGVNLLSDRTESVPSPIMSILAAHQSGLQTDLPQIEMSPVLLPSQSFQTELSSASLPPAMSPASSPSELLPSSLHSSSLLGLSTVTSPASSSPASSSPSELLPSSLHSSSLLGLSTITSPASSSPASSSSELLPSSLHSSSLLGLSTVTSPASSSPASSSSELLPSSLHSSSLLGLSTITSPASSSPASSSSELLPSSLPSSSLLGLSTVTSPASSSPASSPSELLPSSLPSSSLLGLSTVTSPASSSPASSSSELLPSSLPSSSLLGLSTVTSPASSSPASSSSELLPSSLHSSSLLGLSTITSPASSSPASSPSELLPSSLPSSSLLGLSTVTSPASSSPASSSSELLPSSLHSSSLLGLSTITSPASSSPASSPSELLPSSLPSSSLLGLSTVTSPASSSPASSSSELLPSSLHSSSLLGLSTVTSPASSSPASSSSELLPSSLHSSSLLGLSTLTSPASSSPASSSSELLPSSLHSSSLLGLSTITSPASSSPASSPSELLPSSLPSSSLLGLSTVTSPASSSPASSSSELLPSSLHSSSLLGLSTVTSPASSSPASSSSELLPSSLHSSSLLGLSTLTSPASSSPASSSSELLPSSLHSSSLLGLSTITSPASSSPASSPSELLPSSLPSSSLLGLSTVTSPASSSPASSSSELLPSSLHSSSLLGLSTVTSPASSSPASSSSELLPSSLHSSSLLGLSTVTSPASSSPASSSSELLPSSLHSSSLLGLSTVTSPASSSPASSPSELLPSSLHSSSLLGLSTVTSPASSSPASSPSELLPSSLHSSSLLGLSTLTSPASSSPASSPSELLPSSLHSSSLLGLSTVTSPASSSPASSPSELLPSSLPSSSLLGLSTLTSPASSSPASSPSELLPSSLHSSLLLGLSTVTSPASSSPASSPSELLPSSLPSSSLLGLSTLTSPASSSPASSPSELLPSSLHSSSLLGLSTVTSPASSSPASSPSELLPSSLPSSSLLGLSTLTSPASSSPASSPSELLPSSLHSSSLLGLSTVTSPASSSPASSPSELLPSSLHSSSLLGLSTLTSPASSSPASSPSELLPSSLHSSSLLGLSTVTSPASSSPASSPSELLPSSLPSSSLLGLSTLTSPASSSPASSPSELLPSSLPSSSLLGLSTLTSPASSSPASSSSELLPSSLPSSSLLGLSTVTSPASSSPASSPSELLPSSLHSSSLLGLSTVTSPASSSPASSPSELLPSSLPSSSLLGLSTLTSPASSSPASSSSELLPSSLPSSSLLGLSTVTSPASSSPASSSSELLPSSLHSSLLGLSTVTSPASSSPASSSSELLPSSLPSSSLLGLSTVTSPASSSPASSSSSELLPSSLPSSSLLGLSTVTSPASSSPASSPSELLPSSLHSSSLLGLSTVTSPASSSPASSPSELLPSSLHSSSLLGLSTLTSPASSSPASSPSELLPSSLPSSSLLGLSTVTSPASSSPASSSSELLPSSLPSSSLLGLSTITSPASSSPASSSSELLPSSLHSSSLLGLSTITSPSSSSPASSSSELLPSSLHSSSLLGLSTITSTQTSSSSSELIPTEISASAASSEASPYELSPASLLRELWSGSSSSSTPPELSPRTLSPSHLDLLPTSSELESSSTSKFSLVSPLSQLSSYGPNGTKGPLISVSQLQIIMTSQSSLSPSSPATSSSSDVVLKKTSSSKMSSSFSVSSLLTLCSPSAPSSYDSALTRFSTSSPSESSLTSTASSEPLSYNDTSNEPFLSVSPSKPSLPLSQMSALILSHLSQEVSEPHLVVTEESTLNQQMSSVLTSQETRPQNAKGNDSGLPPFQILNPTLPNKNVNTSVHSEPLTQRLPGSNFPQVTTTTTTTTTSSTPDSTTSTTTTQQTITTQLTTTSTSATTTTTASPPRTIATTVSPKWPTTQRVRTSLPRTPITQSSPLNCNLTDRMWVKTVLVVHLRRNRLDYVLKQNLPKGLTLALVKALNDSSVHAQIESLSAVPNVTVGYYVSSGDMVYTTSVVVEALSSYGMDRLIADIRQFVPMVQAVPIPAAPWRPTPAISLMLKTVLRFVGLGDDLRSCSFAQLMEERLENAFAEAEAKVLNSDSKLSVQILSVSQSAGSPAVSLIYVVRNRTVTLNGTVASSLLSRLTAELVGYFLFYPPLITAEPLEYHNLNTSAATKDFWVITVIQDVENSSLEGQFQSFANLMEQRLAELFVVAHQQGVRFKRATTVGSYTVQMVGMRRVLGPKHPAELTYYVQLNGTPLSGTTAAKILNTVDSQTMALTLGYFVQLQAEAVVRGPSNNLWIIASVLAPIGIVTIIIIIITAVLCHKNKGDFKTDGLGNLNPRVKTTYRRDMSYYHQPVQGFDYAKQHLGQLGSDEDSGPLPQAPLPIRDASLSMNKVIHPDGTNPKKTLGGEIRKSRLPSVDGSAVSVESARPVSVRGSTVKKTSTQQNLMQEESKKRSDPYDTSSGSLQLISVKPIAAPPAYSQPASSDRSQDSTVLNGEVNLALKQKSDIEHYRNKIRLKAKKKGYYDVPSAESDVNAKATRQASETSEHVPATRPSSRTPEYDDDRSSTYVKSRSRHSEVQYPAYRSRQSLNSPSPGGTEMDMLVMRERPRKGIRNNGYDTEPEIIEETDVDGLSARHHYGYGRQAKGHSETSTLSSQPSIDEVRQQMHLLLEEAFSLASASHTSSNRRHHYHQQHQAFSPYSLTSIPYSEGPISAPDTMDQSQSGVQWVPPYGHDLYQCSLNKPTFRFTQLPEMVTDSPPPPPPTPPPVPPRTGPAPRRSLQRASSDLGPKAHSAESSVPDMTSQQDSSTYGPIRGGPLPPVTTEPVHNHSGNPMTAVYSIPAPRPGYAGYFISTPPSSYHSPSWMSYPPEPEDVSSPWTDSTPLPGYAEAFPNPRYPRGSAFQWTPRQAVSPPQMEPDRSFSTSAEHMDVITPITLSTSALVQAIRDEVAKLAKKQADMFEFQV